MVSFPKHIPPPRHPCGMRDVIWNLVHKLLDISIAVLVKVGVDSARGKMPLYLQMFMLACLCILSILMTTVRAWPVSVQYVDPTIAALDAG